MRDTYLSVFSGIGGLEHPSVAPLLYCEKDEACQRVLKVEHPEVPIVDDVRGLRDLPRADVVVGGWPCQDISSAGTLGGIHAERSGLFFEMLQAAKTAGAHSLVGENVPNLLSINNGADFRLVLETLSAKGYPYIGWRVLNARQFGLPQQRRRLFIVASRHRKRAEAIHARVPALEKNAASSDVFAFYWTAGTRSICWSRGYAPALKIGATDNRGRAPVAILMDGRLRKLSSRECLRLQGFEDLQNQHPSLSRSVLLRMAGNTVPRPMGHFVVKSVIECAPENGVRTAFGLFTDSGILEDGMFWSVSHAKGPLASNLSEFLDAIDTDPLSSQAAAGLLVRSIRASQPIPLELFDSLRTLAALNKEALQPSRANSFEALKVMAQEILQYRATLVPISEYGVSIEG